MARRASEPMTFARLGKMIWSALFFPVNVVATSCTWAVAEGLKYVNFVEAFFVQSKIFKDTRDLIWDPFWKSFSESGQKSWKWMAGLTFAAATEPLKIISDTTRNISNVAAESVEPSKFADKDKREEKIKTESKIKVEPSEGMVPNPIFKTTSFHDLHGSNTRQSGVTPSAGG